MSSPPPDVQAAAATVQHWLNQQQPGARLSNEDYAKLSPAERLDYARKFDQSQFTQGSKS